jgi:hypothetical protein
MEPWFEQQEAIFKRWLNRINKEVFISGRRVAVNGGDMRMQSFFVLQLLRLSFILEPKHLHRNIQAAPAATLALDGESRVVHRNGYIPREMRESSLSAFRFVIGGRIRGAILFVRLGWCV